MILTVKYVIIKPFYNGYALVTTFEDEKLIINEDGKQVLKV